MIQSCKKFFGTSVGSHPRGVLLSPRTLTFTTNFLHQKIRTGVDSTLRRSRKIGIPTTRNQFVFSPISRVAYFSNFVVIHERLTTCGTRVRRSFSEVSALLSFSPYLTSFQVSVEGSRVQVLSKHPFNAHSTRGVTWSIWNRSQGWPWFGQTKAAPRTTVCQ